MITTTYTGRQAITTKFHGPSNVKGSRVSASCEGGRVICNYEHSLNSHENHASAVIELCRKLNWSGHYVGSGNANGTMSWVDISDVNPSTYRTPIA